MGSFNRCTVPGCTRPNRQGGTAALCSGHYTRLTRWGDVREDLPLGGRSQVERFWEKVDKRGQDECWEWQGSRNLDGYGRFRWDGKPEQAHRVSYELTFGPIPVGQLGLHHCDNPPCVNPTHIYLGTQKENARDRDTRGRSGSHMRRGERNGGSKLTLAQVEDIRERVSSGPRGTRAALVREYGISESQMHRILTGASWSASAA